MELIEAVQMRIKNILKEKGMSNYRLVRLAGLNEKTVDDILKLRSKNVKLSTLVMICVALDMTLTEFFSDKLFKKVNLKGWAEAAKSQPN